MLKVLVTANALFLKKIEALYFYVVGDEVQQHFKTCLLSSSFIFLLPNNLSNTHKVLRLPRLPYFSRFNAHLIQSYTISLSTLISL